MLENLRKSVCEANIRLENYNLVSFTWGNVSQIDREKKLVVCKPGGVKHSMLSPEKMIIVDLDGNIVEGELTPLSDLLTHLELYKRFDCINSVVHTHSRWATAWAQAGKPIKPYGATHANYFYGEIPCTREMTGPEILQDYEKNTGKVIAETFENINPLNMPAVLVKSHGPFCWGADADEAVENAAVLEEVAMIAYDSVVLSSLELKTMQKSQLDKHFFRKHDKNVYCGQR
ncbi:MAG TPA: L-ribulose-5-phosphate 4-epimerase [Ruminococcaceae bacterium]|nr:L-ribulose-5-phosphate 4-epimerase [Oscillospiraceae bacterium]